MSTYGHEAQAQVAEFHKALDLPISRTPGLRRVDLRCALLAEECKETIEAAEVGDLVGAIDGLCDLLVVAYGAALEWGVDIEPFFQEVHRTNMAKVGGPKRHDGKQLKPEGWQPPDIAGILREQIIRATSVRLFEDAPAGVSFGEVREVVEGEFNSIIGRGNVGPLGA